MARGRYFFVSSLYSTFSDHGRIIYRFPATTDPPKLTMAPSAFKLERRDDPPSLLRPAYHRSWMFYKLGLPATAAMSTWKRRYTPSQCGPSPTLVDDTLLELNARHHVTSDAPCPRLTPLTLILSTRRCWLTKSVDIRDGISAASPSTVGPRVVRRTRMPPARESGIQFLEFQVFRLVFYLLWDSRRRLSRRGKSPHCTIHRNIEPSGGKPRHTHDQFCQHLAMTINLVPTSPPWPIRSNTTPHTYSDKRRPKPELKVC